jgi:hypothetical protein
MTGASLAMAGAAPIRSEKTTVPIATLKFLALTDLEPTLNLKLISD